MKKSTPRKLILSLFVAGLLILGASSVCALATTESSKTTSTSTTSTKNGLLKDTDGKWRYYKKGEVVTGPILVKNSSGKWYINENGILDFKYTGYATDGTDWYYCVGSKVSTTTTGCIRGELDGTLGWWYIVNGKVSFTTAIVKCNGSWWSVIDGKISFKDGTAKNSSGRWVIEGGKITFKYTGFYKYEDAYYYVSGSKFQTSTTSVIKGSVDGVTAWWYVKNGKVTITDTVAENANGFWAIKDGKVDFTYEGLLANDYGYWYCKSGRVQKSFVGVVKTTYKGETAWWYIKSGKLTITTDVVKNSTNNLYYYVVNGKVDFSVSSVVKSSNGWWVISEGKALTSYTGFYINTANKTYWYCKNGKILFSATGVYRGTVGDITGYWKVTSGKVIAQYTNVTGKTIGTVNMRSGAGTSSSIVTTLPANATFKIKNEKTVDSTTWYYATYDGHTGWVSEKYVLVLFEDDYTETLVTNISGTCKTSAAINMRSGPSTSYSVITKIPKGTTVSVYGAQKDSSGTYWFRITYQNQVGFISKAYTISLNTKYNSASGTDAEFEAYLDEQGFPESYKKQLRQLHAKYPNWVFKADHISDSWGTNVSMQYAFASLLPDGWSGTKAVSIIDKSVKNSWKSTDSDAYNSSTKTYKTGWDGDSWVIPSKGIVRYYLDPRNFLDDVNVFQFLDMSYDSSQTESAVSTAANNVGASWLSGSYTHTTDNTTIDYAKVLAASGKSAGMNPITLVCIITQELGVTDTAITRNQISGTVSGYEGYYNYFNIGAYVDANYSKAYLRGLYIATKKGWNTREKAILGGANYYADEYVENNQNTVYYKRFNVANGSCLHQFSTDIQGARSEGKLLSKAYGETLKKSLTLTFYIPVYDGMTSAPCQMPE